MVTILPDTVANDEGVYVWIAAKRADITNLPTQFRNTPCLTKGAHTY